MNNALEITGLTKRYPGFTLDHLSFSLPEGCIMGLIGENGAGKTTALKLMLGWYIPTREARACWAAPQWIAKPRSIWGW